nr:arginine--tRNA ligase, chloroplastic/mitochondrial [Tanacetum cinerariifolium]
EDVLTICQGLRSIHPDLFSLKRPLDIAQELIEDVKKNQKSVKMLDNLHTHDVGYITFNLSSEWMVKRIKKMLGEGIDTWAPVNLDRAVVNSPTLAIGADLHADVIRSCYIREMISRMLAYSGVAVGHRDHSYWSRDAEEAIRKIPGRTGRSPLNNVFKDLGTLWQAINVQRGELIVFVTPVRQREHVEQCIAAAETVKWLPGEWSPTVLCIGYRTSSTEREKLDSVWNEFESHPKAAYLVRLGNGYDKKGQNPSKTGQNRAQNEKRGKVIDSACLTFQLHPVCEYVRNLCKKFTSYWEEVLQHLDLKTFRSKLFLCDASRVVMQKCFHLLGITPGLSRTSSRVMLSKLKRVPWEETPFEDHFIPLPVSDARPEHFNSRFEMFGMNVIVYHPDFEMGDVYGNVSLIDKEGLLFDQRLALDKNDNGHVSYFYHELDEAIGICRNSDLFFGNPSPPCRYKAVLFHADVGFELKVGQQELKKSVMAVPADGCLMIEAVIFDVKAGKYVLNGTQELHPGPNNHSEASKNHGTALLRLKRMFEGMATGECYKFTVLHHDLLDK